MSPPTLPIVTGRLTLRLLEASDYDALFDYYSKAEVTTFLYDEPATASSFAARFDRKLGRRVLRAGDALVLAVIERSSNTVVGDVTFMWTSAEHRQGEIGYVLDPRHRGRGYATEAAEALLKLGFEDLALHRLAARLDARNADSAAVLERLGMRLEAHHRENEFVKGEWTDELVYGLLASEWSGRRPGTR